MPAARHALAALELGDPQGATVELLTSELVSNAILHGARDPYESILVLATKEDSRVRVRVCDEGTNSGPQVKQADLLDTGGRGLQLVDALADRWGTERDETACVWFELESPAG